MAVVMMMTDLIIRRVEREEMAMILVFSRSSFSRTQGRAGQAGNLLARPQQSTYSHAITHARRQVRFLFRRTTITLQYRQLNGRSSTS
jgi:hypothetical protein